MKIRSPIKGACAFVERGAIAAGCGVAVGAIGASALGGASVCWQPIDRFDEFFGASAGEIWRGAVASHRAALEDAALEEWTCERVPLDWAVSFGSQRVALMLIADLPNGANMAETAVRQIEIAYETTRSGGDEPTLAYFQAQLAKAQAIRDRLGAVDYTARL